MTPSLTTLFKDLSSTEPFNAWFTYHLVDGQLYVKTYDDDGLVSSVFKASVTFQEI